MSTTRPDVDRPVDIDIDIGVVGAGYVGLTTAAGMAHLGHRVTAVDVDAQRVDALRHGQMPLREPELDDTVRRENSAGRLRFDENLGSLRTARVVFVAVPTPQSASGAADLEAVFATVRALGDILEPGSVIVAKSTVPVGTTRRCAEVVAHRGLKLVTNPEFLREGHTLEDFLAPDRIVVGSDDEVSAWIVADLYAPLSAPVYFTSPESAELAKYTSNAMLALRLSFVNELAELCDRVGADIRDVTHCVGADSRIGPAFLAPGPGWGGSCLPKDTAALLHTATGAGVQMRVLDAAVAANREQPARVVAAIAEAVTGSPDGCLAGTDLALLGLTFKAGTADRRDSPALTVARALADSGAHLCGYDPADPDGTGAPIAGLVSVPDPYAAAERADALVVLTEWPQFAELDWARLAGAVKHRTVVDTRNIIDLKSCLAHGFSVASNGIGSRAAYGHP